jgi:hypothetical protein
MELDRKQPNVPGLFSPARHDHRLRHFSRPGNVFPSATTCPQWYCKYTVGAQLLARSFQDCSFLYMPSAHPQSRTSDLNLQTHLLDAKPGTKEILQDECNSSSRERRQCTAGKIEGQSRRYSRDRTGQYADTACVFVSRQVNPTSRDRRRGRPKMLTSTPSSFPT